GQMFKCDARVIFFFKQKTAYEIFTQPNTTSTTTIAAWDVSVRDAANTRWIPGRVYTNVMNMTLNTSNVDANRSFFGTVYALTKDGYVYRVKGNGFQGMYYTFLINNVGFYAPDLPGNAWTAAQWKAATPTTLPSYKSFNYSTYSDIITDGPWLQDPRTEDTSTGITHK